MKIKTYTDPAREVPNGFTCGGCGAVRNESLGKRKYCSAFRRELLAGKDGCMIKCFECVLACRSALIAAGTFGGKNDEKDQW